MRIKTLLFLVFLINGCALSKPGYITKIQLYQDAGIVEEDITLIISVLNIKPHEIIKQNERDNWRSVSYRIYLAGNELSNLENNSIIVGIEYYYKKSNLQNNKHLEKIVVRVGNTREGGKPYIKKEIDSLTDQIVDLLSKRFDSSLINIERKTVHPM